jgi:hypothetical protein
VSVSRDRSDEELAQTATAPSSSDPLPRDVVPLTEQLGRYKIQRELGRGGMGVVYAVFDPDLERKVALKVLRGAGDSAEARQRLLREARAMARLAHPNVLTVHEVGSASGQDFIAMELVDGSTLEDWLSASPRSEREIIAAFTLAGRGLAAAHAAGLVHRDFKPRNVLRHKDGRIAVTDFGLVVGVAPQVDVTTTTLPGEASTDSSTTPSSLSGLTQTGALLGTPAYMSPEQWTGGTVGPPADQFAFCVALWEALAKDRPYKGTTLEELQDQVMHAKRSDETKLPRKLRSVLRRGLDPDPAKRYPSIDALLAAIARAERRPIVPISIAGAAMIGIAGVAVVTMSKHAVPPGASCAAPLTAVDKAWSAHDRDQFRGMKQGFAADALDRDVTTWTEVRARACNAPPALATNQLACLDGVLGRIALTKSAVLELHPRTGIDLSEYLVDPHVCDSATPPRLLPMTSPQMHELTVAKLKGTGALTEQTATTLIADTKPDPCAYVYALSFVVRSGIAGSERSRMLEEADRNGPLCNDDRALADFGLAQLYMSYVAGDPAMVSKIDHVAALISRVNQADFHGDLEELRRVLAGQTGHLDDVIDHEERAAQFFEQRGAIRRGMRAQLALAGALQERATQADFARVPSLLDDARAKLVAAFGEHDYQVRDAIASQAQWIWDNGDVAKADAMRADVAITTASPRPFTARGKVVDERGTPVADAVVTVGRRLDGDSLHAAIPDDGQWTAKTDASGQFEIKDADSDSIAIAQLDNERSRPELVRGADLTLVLAPTSRVSGKVVLHDRPPSLVAIAVGPDPERTDMFYALNAPVQPDGTFVVDGVPRNTKLRIATQTPTGTGGWRINVKPIIVTQPVVENVQLEVKPNTGNVSVLVRAMYGEDLNLAMVFVASGTAPAETNYAKMATSLESSTQLFASRLTPDQDSPSVHVKSKQGDLFVLVPDRPVGTASVCAMPLPKTQNDADFGEPMRKHPDKIPMRCVPLGPKDDVVVITIPPWPRFD